MMRVAGVHGVGNYRPGEEAAAAIAQVWTEALAVQAEVEVAYYADLLRAKGKQGGAGEVDGLDEFELELVRAWLDELPVPEGVAAGRATWPVRQALSWLSATRFPGRTGLEWFVATFFREVATYLRDEAARLVVRDRVAETIAGYEPDVVIAHSLGSVVAYETLWACPELKVPLLVTLGSPLALPHAVFDRLEHGDAGRPPNVARWLNLADPGDVVAIPVKGVGRRFTGVDLDEHTAIHAFDFHLVKNYLAHPRLAEVLVP